MYLKSIEVQGFKSFANKILFEFHNGITGIVGPNGSGKSNVGDAVRWVLGEQSAKQLRGSNMQDVIFSGTENRKPLGYASVAITMDNSDHKLSIDFEEVTVARKVYRSGESEYLINGSSCRLKDVQELFYDTGIGKEGYSMIGQGQIDRILSGKPEERRELFDEAAGIVKFKKRKKSAQKNLENERNNLVRINDILSELEKQVGPLEKQSEKARIYLKKREELKNYDVNMFLLEINRIKSQLKEIEDKIQIVVEEATETEEQYERTKSAYDEIQTKTREVEENMEEAQNAFNQASVMSQRLEGEMNVLKEQIRSISSSGERVKERKVVVEEEINTRKTQQEKLDEENQILQNQLQDMQKENQESQNQIQQVQETIREYSEKIEQAKNTIIQRLNDKASTQGNQQRYDTMLEQVQIRKAQLNQRILTLKTRESEGKDVLQKYEDELSSITDTLLDLTGQDNELKKNCDEWSAMQKQKSLRLMEIQKNFHREQSRLDSLINITERYDGYSNAIRRVMEQKSRNQGLHGVVADLIKTEKKYETAIETALGGSIQNIVTDNEQTAKKMIEYLKKNHLGRATFLPLNNINAKSGFPKEEALNETGAIGSADMLIQTEEQYRSLIVQLLGRTLVVDTMDHAIFIAKKFRHTLRIVTLEGELLSPGGSMTGGAFKNSSNLLGRRREIEELQEQVADTKEKMEQLTRDIELQKQKIAEAEEERKHLAEKLQETYLLQNTTKMNWNQAQKELNEVSEKYAGLRMEREEMESQIQTIGQQKQLMSDEVIQIETQVEALNENIDLWQDAMTKEQEAEVQISSVVSEQQIGQAGLEQKQANVIQNIKRLGEEVQRFKTEMKSLAKQLEEIHEQACQKEEQITKMQEAFEASEQEKSDKKGLLTQYSEEKEALSVNNRAFLEKREELLERKNDLDKEHTRLEGQKEKLEESHETSMAYMWEEYELTYNSALPLKDDQFTDASSLKQMVRQIRDEIRRLGDVNVNSIEEYKNVKERFDFLNNQRNDLLEAEQTLLNIIAELDEGMRKQFREKFEEIRVEFDKVFKELFGGGKGTLELDEDEDILEAGIRINSQPPGKKLGNMMQLSGGEKALTAISLLFAIQNLKPSPFCLLDEIEAALDDSNVVRYAKYLHKLSANTQFIVITHRRGTMESADRLYGITMQEKGVSTLVSVDLIEKELEEKEES